MDCTNADSTSSLTPEKRDDMPEIIADTPEQDLGTLMSKEKKRAATGRSFLSSARSLSNIGIKKIKDKNMKKNPQPSRTLEEALKDPSISGYIPPDVTFEAALHCAVGLSSNQVLATKKHDPFMMPSPMSESKCEKRKRSESSPIESDLKRSRVQLAGTNNVRDRLSMATGKGDPLDDIAMSEHTKLAEILDELKTVPQKKKISRMKNKSEGNLSITRASRINSESVHIRSELDDNIDANDELSAILGELRDGPSSKMNAKNNSKPITKCTENNTAPFSSRESKCVASFSTIERKFGAPMLTDESKYVSLLSTNESQSSENTMDIDINKHNVSGILNTSSSELCVQSEGQTDTWSSSTIPAHFFLRYNVADIQKDE